MENINKKDIAVIGMACRFSHSNDADEFWTNLRNGKELLHFYTPQELEDRHMEKHLIDDPLYIKVGAAVADKDSFDFSFFGYTKEEAAIMDPQTRLFHEYTWKALEDAGYDPYQYPGKIGLFAGAADNINWVTHAMLTGSEKHMDPFFRDIIAEKNYLSTLVSYKLNLKGPGYFINTSCSTALSVVHIACRNLLMKECNMAIAGAVRINTTATIGYRYEEGMIYSKDGHCRAFDADSSGTISGEGIGVLILKRLNDALNDGDHIYAVIKSSAVNNDGNRKVGYTAPSATGQAECIKMAHAMAGISPETISYVETHGTATRLGDPIEIQALNLAFGNNKHKHCAIGSVKSNMGHLDTAAGMAGIIKTILALHNREIPPSLHYKTPNPEINFDDGPFYVNTTLKKWNTESGLPLRAGVSSFGIGGTNVHVVLEEAPVIETGTTANNHHLLLCSANSKTALANQLKALRSWLEQHNTNLPDIAFTLQNRRKHFKYRHYVVCEDHEGAVRQLATDMEDKTAIDRHIDVVFMFPGQGSQYRNMGRELYHTAPSFKERMKAGFDMLKKITGYDYEHILFGSDEDPESALINETLHAQPILFLFEYALAELLMKWGIRPSCMIGHSIGELTAACIGGVFTFEDGLYLVTQRARLMSNMSGGAMLGIELPPADIIPFLDDRLSVAAVNTARRCVVSGTFEAIALLSVKLGEQGIACRRLSTSHAFHSGMMEPMMNSFRESAASVALRKPAIPFVSNVSGKIAGDEVLSPLYWAKHIRETVRFADGIGQLMHTGKKIFIEIGPGNTLTTFCKQVGQEGRPGHLSLNLVRHPLEKKEDGRLMAERLGELWANGVTINWSAFYGPGIRKAVSLPTYCFDKNRFPVNVDPIAEIYDLVLSNHLTGKKEQVRDWFYSPCWKRSTLVREHIAGNGNNCCLLFSDEGEVASGLYELLLNKGHQVIKVIRGKGFAALHQYQFQVDPLNDHDFGYLAEALQLNGYSPDLFIHTWTFEDNTGMKDFLSLVKLFKGFRMDAVSRQTNIFFLTKGLQNVFDDEILVNAEKATALGALKIMSQENPSIFCCNVDISPAENAAKLAAHIYDELCFNTIHPVVALRNGSRWIESGEPVFLNDIPVAGNAVIKQGGTYLITGGLGKAGICLAEHLLQQYRANVILTGRTPLPSREEWDAARQHDHKIADKIDALQKLYALGGAVTYYHADIADHDELFRVVEQAESAFGAINGIIHAAGNTDESSFKAIELIDELSVAEHFRPKVNGLMNLYRIFKDKHPDFVWITSSLSAVLGGLTYGAYAASNLFMDYFITSRRHELKNWICIDLDGLSLEDSGLPSHEITRTELKEIFERSFKVLDHHRIIISVADLEERINKHVRKINKPVKPAVNPVQQLAATTAAYVVENRNGETLTAPETKMMEIWKGLFGIDDIDADTDFFDLGGDSLKAMTLLKRIHKELGVDIPIKIFFANSSIRLLTGQIEKGLEGVMPVDAVDNNNVRMKEMII